MKHAPYAQTMLLPLGKPRARAEVAGGSAYPKLSGRVSFYAAGKGTLLTAEFRGLPYDAAPCASNVLSFHIHAGGACTGAPGSPFSDALGHYNPGDCPHPAHAGDLPPLFSNRGFAFQAFYTERFTPEEAVGKTVIVHDKRDDFTSQPAGDSGNRIGCGVIERV
ncbi:MAG TPA: superoxide dismutase family protein [Clostridia bacterium]|nr:superoxide dismutase family protein [Clostridia bacterium]